MTSIADARALPDGASVTVDGVLTTALGALESGRTAFLQDATAGIAVYLDAAVVDPLPRRDATRRPPGPSTRGTSNGPCGSAKPDLRDRRTAGRARRPRDRRRGPRPRRSRARASPSTAPWSAARTTLADGLAVSVDDGSGPVRIVVGDAALGGRSLAAGSIVRAVGPLGPARQLRHGHERLPPVRDARRRPRRRAAPDARRRPSARPRRRRLTRPPRRRPRHRRPPVPPSRRTRPRRRAVHQPVRQSDADVERDPDPVGPLDRSGPGAGHRDGRHRHGRRHRRGRPARDAAACSPSPTRRAGSSSGCRTGPRRRHEAHASRSAVRWPTRTASWRSGRLPAASSSPGPARCRLPSRSAPPVSMKSTEGRLALATGVVAGKPSKSTSGDIALNLELATGTTLRVFADASSGVTATAFVVGGHVPAHRRRRPAGDAQGRPGRLSPLGPRSIGRRRGGEPDTEPVGHGERDTRAVVHASPSTKPTATPRPTASGAATSTIAHALKVDRP